MVATRTYTVEEVERTPPPGDWELDDWELIDGNLFVVPAAGVAAAMMVANLGYLVGSHVYPRRLGSLYMKAGFKLFPDRETLVGPSLAFVDGARVPAARQFGFLHFPPDLAVELVGPFRTVAWALRRGVLYLDAGTRLVWIVDPVGRRVSVLTPDQWPITLGESDTLDGGDVVPGFSVRVAEIFE